MTPLKNVLVTVGIPNYNYASHITTALDSVVNQTYQNIELIIVDDCSTDKSPEIIEKWINAHKEKIAIKFIRNKENLGLTGVCNIILKNASGKYFQTLDADDVLMPGKLSAQVQLLEGEENTALVYSNIAVIDGKGEVIKDDYLDRIGYNKNNMPSGNIHQQLFDFNFIPLPSVLVNTEMARVAGGFDESLQVQDYYLWLKLSETYKIVYMPGNTAMYRVHAGSMSNSIKTNPKSVESVLDIKYRYYQQASIAIKNKIRKNIHYSAVYLYENEIPSAPLWLKRDFLLNPGLKSLAYFIAINLGIPFSFIGSIRKKLSAK